MKTLCIALAVTGALLNTSTLADPVRQPEKLPTRITPASPLVTENNLTRKPINANLDATRNLPIETQVRMLEKRIRLIEADNRNLRADLALIEDATEVNRGLVTITEMGMNQNTATIQVIQNATTEFITNDFAAFQSSVGSSLSALSGLLANKADTTTVNAQLSAKADLVALDAVAANVDVVTEDLTDISDQLKNNVYGLITTGKIRLDGNNDLVFEGLNVNIRNGSGSTYNSVENLSEGLGNLILGYNNPGSGSLQRDGSHNLVIGDANDYRSFAGIVHGIGNSIGPGAHSAVVFSATHSSALHELTSVSGGDKVNTLGFREVLLATAGIGVTPLWKRGSYMRLSQGGYVLESAKWAGQLYTTKIQSGEQGVHPVGSLVIQTSSDLRLDSPNDLILNASEISMDNYPVGDTIWWLNGVEQN